MKIETKFFGEIEVDEQKVFDFEDGLPGFPNEKKFVLITDGEPTDETLVFWLQSVETTHVAFPLLNMQIIKPDYNPDVSELLPPYMGRFEERDYPVYNVAVIPQDVDKMTVNLRAPIVISNNLKKGCQVIFNNDEYPIKHLVFNELQNLQKAGE